MEWSDVNVALPVICPRCGAEMSIEFQPVCLRDQTLEALAVCECGKRILSGESSCEKQAIAKLQILAYRV